MRIIKTIGEFRTYRQALPGKTGFVPTMGYLHAGHISLVEASRRSCEHTLVSIFVNPTQFGPNEDFTRYPRDFEHDCQLCEDRHVDCIFCPEVKEMYPGDELTSVQVSKITEPLCGRSRPTHFRGVTTAVAKLFNIVQPHTAFFGQKDLQQSIVVRRMVHDLNIPIEIEVCPIVREPDGLALSSRNRYLSAAERELAPVLCRSLQNAKRLFERGESSAAVLRTAVEHEIREVLGEAGRIDYVELVDINSLDPVSRVRRGDAVSLAVFLGRTRLIDNTVF